MEHLVILLKKSWSVISRNDRNEPTVPHSDTSQHFQQMSCGSFGYPILRNAAARTEK